MKAKKSWLLNTLQGGVVTINKVLNCEQQTNTTIGLKFEPFQQKASLWVCTNVDFVALFLSNRRFFNEIIAFRGVARGGVLWEPPSPTFKASGLANAISSFSFVITLLTAMKCLSVLKPLSVKVEKRDVDVYEADMSRIER